ncbi:hypothetical protein [Bacillus toyonensis]|uniref:hypothetical protein n=1 Tax=Bacillus toyonensis TaxID=155322 RepID=UPI003D196DC6
MCNQYGYDPYSYGYGGCNGNGDLYGNEGIRQFLRRLTPGTCILIQYDSQRPVRAVFQEFRRRTIVVSDVKGFHPCTGFTHIAINKINSVSVLSHCPNWEDCEED